MDREDLLLDFFDTVIEGARNEKMAKYHLAGQRLIFERKKREKKRINAQAIIDEDKRKKLWRRDMKDITRAIRKREKERQRRDVLEIMAKREKHLACCAICDGATEHEGRPKSALCDACRDWLAKYGIYTMTSLKAWLLRDYERAHDVLMEMGFMKCMHDGKNEIDRMMRV